MKISIITCTRNSMQFLDQTVQSVRQQVDCAYEHIFVDGSSTDGTLEYLRQLQTHHPARILENVGGGIGAAMNEGIRAASGDIIAHLHSDDYYLGTETLARVTRVFRDTGCQWLFGRILSDVDGQLKPESYTVPTYAFDTLLQKNFIPHPATFVRKSVFDTHGVFDLRWRYAMDYDFFLRIARHHAPVQLDEHLAVFRRHDGSATQANFMKSFREDFEVRRQHCSWYQLPEALLRYQVRRRRHLQRLSAAGA